MFENPSTYKNQDKICSISNFSSSQNSKYLNEQQIATQAKHFANKLKRQQQKQFHKPVFIITQNLQAKHINTLTQILQKNQVPIQFQHQTQSLGQQLNTKFFVVVDNKNGTIKLGKQFNSPLMTVVGYPKIGNNKQNIYCQYAEDVFTQYKEFINANTKSGLVGQEYQFQRSQLNSKAQESMMKSASNGFSILRSEVSGLKLKSISKYDRKKREVSQKELSYNKENLTSIRDIYNQNQQIHNIYFIQSPLNQPFNDMIGRYYHEIKLNTAKKIEQTIFYYKSQVDLIKKLNQFNPFVSGKSLIKRNNQKDDSTFQSKTNPTKLHYVLINSQAALKLATRINCEFYSFKDKIRFIVVMLNLPNTSSNDDENLQKDMLLVKKTIESNLFHSLVCSQEQCEKTLKSIGYNFKYEVPLIKVTPNQCKSILTKSHTKLNGTQKGLKSQKEVPISQDMISFCPKLKNSVQINEGENKNQTLRSEQCAVQPERQNNLMNQTQQFVPQKSGFSPSPNKSRIIIPAINSLLSPQKSTVSSNGSKIKIIRILKKQPSNLTPLKDQQRGKSISQVNSEYCINKNKSIIQKMQSKMAISNSRTKINVSEQGSHKSIQKHLKSQQKLPNNKSNVPESKISINSSQVSLRSPINFMNRKDSNTNLAKKFQNDYQCVKSPETKKVKKMRINLYSEEPFVTRCSRVTQPDDQQSQSSYKNIRKLKKQTKETSQNPMSASQYYFGTSTDSNTKWQQQPSPLHQQNLINGLVHVQYNEVIASIVNEFKQKCPSSIINKDQYKPFYLACEYSRQIKKIWKNSKKRSILPSLIDLQGLKEIYKYYSNIMYEDDQLQFYSTVQDKLAQKNQNSMQNTGKFTVQPQQSDGNSHMLLFFTIVTQKQVDDHIFQRLDWIAERLPKHQVIKCIIEENMQDNQMKQKAKQIYTQMIGYLTELKEEYGAKFVQTV